MAPHTGAKPASQNKGKAVNSAVAAAHVAAQKAEKRIGLEEAKRKFTRLDAFEGMYAFLTLDAACQACWHGQVFSTARHAFLAAQYPDRAKRIADTATPAEAHEAVSGGLECDGWEAQRLQAMERIQRDKFRRSAEFRSKLKDTGDRELVWENEEDGFWGALRGRGQNQLGRILMDIRSNIQNDTEFETWLALCCEVESDALKRVPVELLEQKGGEEDGEVEQKKVHRLAGKSHFKMGKLSTNSVVALHPSVSREHAMVVHTRSRFACRSHGLAIMDLGSKAGTSVGGRKLSHPFVLEPLPNGDVIRLGASTRSYVVRVNLASQIQMLEQQERELLKEVQSIDADAANPIEAAKRAARDEATIFVGNLDYETEKADLLGLLQDCGKVEEVRFPGDDSSKATKGICFVTLDSAIAARRACGLSGELFKGRRLKIQPAEGRRPQGDSGKGSGKSGGGKAGSTGGRDDHNGRTLHNPAAGGSLRRQCSSMSPRRQLGSETREQRRSPDERRHRRDTRTKATSRRRARSRHRSSEKRSSSSLSSDNSSCSSSCEKPHKKRTKAAR